MREVRTRVVREYQPCIHIKMLAEYIGRHERKLLIGVLIVVVVAAIVDVVIAYLEVSVCSTPA